MEYTHIFMIYTHTYACVCVLKRYKIGHHLNSEFKWRPIFFTIFTLLIVNILFIMNSITFIKIRTYIVLKIVHEMYIIN